MHSLRDTAVLSARDGIPNCVQCAVWSVQWCSVYSEQCTVQCAVPLLHWIYELPSALLYVVGPVLRVRGTGGGSLEQGQGLAIKKFSLSGPCGSSGRTFLHSC